MDGNFDFDQLSKDYGLSSPALPKTAQKSVLDAAKIESIKRGAKKLGISPLDYATVISYETAGTFDPWKAGPVTKWGQHRGTIQYGEPQRTEFNVYEGQPFEDQVENSNVRYLKKNGVRPGMKIDSIYRAINGGNVNVSGEASDGYGTINSHIEKMNREHRPKLSGLFNDSADSYDYDQLANEYGLNDTQINSQPQTDFDALSQEYGLAAPAAPAPKSDVINNLTAQKTVLENDLRTAKPQDKKRIQQSLNLLNESIAAENEQLKINKQPAMQPQNQPMIGGAALALEDFSKIPFSANTDKNVVEQKVQTNNFDNQEIRNNYKEFLRVSGLPDNQKSTDEFNRLMKLSVDGANAQNSKDIAVYNRRLKNHQVNNSINAKKTEIPPASDTFEPAVSSANFRINLKKGDDVRRKLNKATIDYLSANYGIEAQDAEKALKDFPLNLEEGGRATDTILQAEADRNGFIDHTVGKDVIERARQYKQQRINQTEAKKRAILDYIASGRSLSDTDIEELRKEGISLGDIDQNEYTEAVEMGKAGKQRAQGLFADYKQSGDTDAIAMLKVRRDVGWITPEDYQTKVNQEIDAQESLKKSVRDSNAVFENETGIFKKGADFQEINRQLDKMLDGESAIDYIDNQARIAKEYENRPLARPLEFAKKFYKAFPKAVSSLLQSASIAQNIAQKPLADAIDFIAGTDLNKTINADNGLGMKLGNYLDEAIEKAAPSNKDFSKEFFITTLPDTLGQLTVQTLAGIATGGATLPTVLGMTQGASSQYKDAAKFTNNQNLKLSAAVIGGLLASTDSLVFKGWFKTAGEAEKAGFFDALKQSIATRLYRAGIDVSEKEALEIAETSAQTFLQKIGKFALESPVEGGKEGFQELTENKGNAAFAYLTYDKSDERRKAADLTSLTEDDVASVLGGFIGVVAGHSLAHHFEKGTLEEKLQSVDSFSAQIDKLVRAGKIDQSIAEKAKEKANQIAETQPIGDTVEPQKKAVNLKKDDLTGQTIINQKGLKGTVVNGKDKGLIVDWENGSRSLAYRNKIEIFEEKPDSVTNDDSTQPERISPVPEKQETLDAQIEAVEDKSLKSAAVLFTDGEDVPRLRKGFSKVNVREGIVYINNEKADAVFAEKGFGKFSAQKLEKLLESGKLSMTDMIGGKAVDFGDNTSGGTALISKDKDGNELVASKISDNSPENLNAEDLQNVEKQKELDAERFGKDKIASQEITETEKVATDRQIKMPETELKSGNVWNVEHKDGDISFERQINPTSETGLDNAFSGEPSIVKRNGEPVLKIVKPYSSNYYLIQPLGAKVEDIPISYGETAVIARQRAVPLAQSFVEGENQIEKLNKQKDRIVKYVKGKESTDIIAVTDKGFHFPVANQPNASEWIKRENAKLESKSATDAAHDAATSPANDLPQPTEAQKEAGNYPKGHIAINGLNISVENPESSVRDGTDRDGKKWEVEMQHHYGYIKGTIGADGEQIDIFVKDGTPRNFSGNVFIVDQNHPDTGKFDEHKIMLGYSSESEARKAYLSNYEKNWKGLDKITAMPFEDFKAWTKNEQTKPVAENAEVSDTKNQTAQTDSDKLNKPQESSKTSDTKTRQRGFRFAPKVNENIMENAGEILQAARINNDEINLENLYNKDGEIDYEQVKDIAGRIVSGEIEIIRLNNREEQGRILGGQRNVEASVICGAETSADRTESRGNSQTKEDRIGAKRRVEAQLEKYAKNENIWFDYDEFVNSHTHLKDGQEARVFEDTDPRFVVKLANYSKFDEKYSPGEFIDERISLFNSIFPVTHYELIGFTRDRENQFHFVLKQSFIDGEPATVQARVEFMKRILGEDSELTVEQFANREYHVSDLHDDNVLQDQNGNVFVIDAITELTPKRLRGVRKYEKFTIRNTENGKSSTEIVQAYTRNDDGRISGNQQQGNSGKLTESGNPADADETNLGQILKSARSSELLAPNGKPSNLTPEQHSQVRTKEFKEWFGDWENDAYGESSYMLDENGEPKVFYHRTNNEFDTFEHSYHGSSTDRGWLGEGFYFYGEQSEAYGYGDKEIAAFLNIRNPYYAESEDNQRLAEADDLEVSKEFTQNLKDDGFDGVYYNGDLRQETVAFEPNQIKSATDNNGKFDTNNPSILKKSRDFATVSAIDEIEGADLGDLLDSAKPDDLVRDGYLLETASLPVYEIVRRAVEDVQMSQGNDEPPRFDALYLNPSQVKAVVDTLRSGAKEAVNAGVSAENTAKIESLANTIEDAAKIDGSAIVYLFDDAIPHEEWHKTGYQNAVDKKLAERHTPENLKKLANSDTVKKLRDGAFSMLYANASDAVVVEETSAWLAGGGREKLNDLNRKLGIDEITEEEADNFLVDWALSFKEKNPNANLDEFAKINEYAGKIIEKTNRVASENRSTNGTAETNRRNHGQGTNVEESSGTSPSERSETKDENGLKERQTIVSAEESGVVGKNAISGDARYYKVKSRDANVRAAQEIIEKDGLAQATVAAKMIPETVSAEFTAFQMEVVNLLNRQADEAVNAGDKAQAAAKLAEAQSIVTALAQKSTELGQAISQLAAWQKTDPNAVTGYVQKRRAQNDYQKPLTPEESKALRDSATEVQNLNKQVADLQQRIDELEQKITDNKSDKKRRNPIEKRIAADLSKKSVTAIERLKARFGIEPILQMTAWHGSPHRFDKFDSSKIGTGEGNQSYGHGLYFAEAEEVADFYKNMLSRSKVQINSEIKRIDELIAERENRIANEQKTLELIKKDGFLGVARQQDIDMLKAEIKSLREKQDDLRTQGGAKYKVDLKPAESDYLLWDKPLNEQSEKVQKALKKDAPLIDYRNINSNGIYQFEQDDIFYRYDNGKYVNRRTGETVTQIEYENALKKYTSIEIAEGKGHQIYQNISKSFGDDATASNYLKSLGIRGIKYLDSFSRDSSDGSYNYVIFDDADVEIEQILQMARPLSESQTSQLDADTLQDFSDIGADILMSGSKENPVTVADFRKQMVEIFGDDIRPHLTEIHALSVKNLKQIKSDAYRERAIEALKHIEGNEDLSIEDLNAIVDKKIQDLKDRAKIRGEHKKEANKFTKEQEKIDELDDIPSFAKSLFKVADIQNKEILVGALLLETGQVRNVDELVKKIRQTFPNISSREALNSASLAARARKLAHDDLEIEREKLRKEKTEAQKEASAIKRDRNQAVRQLLNRIKFLENKPPSYSERLGRLYQSALVSAVQTSVNNFLTAQATRKLEASADLGEVLINKALRKIGEIMGKELNWQYDDKLSAETKYGDILGISDSEDYGVADVVKHFYTDAIFARSIANSVLDESPMMYEALFGSFASDIAVLREQTGANGKADWLLQKIEQGYDKANVLNSMQEFFIRSQEFNRSLQLRLGMRGLNLTDIIKNDEVSKKITEEDLQFAVNRALRMTFALKPDKNTKFGKLVDLYKEATPGILSPFIITFPNFLYNATKFVSDYAPAVGLAKAGYKAAINKNDSFGKSLLKEANPRVIAQQSVGTVLFLAALGLVRMAGDDDKWYYLKTPFTNNDGKNYYIDVRGYQPFASLIFLANKVNRIIDGKPVFSNDDDWAAETLEAMTGLSTRNLSENKILALGEYGLKASAESLSIYHDDEKNWERLKYVAQQQLGEIGGGFLRPLKVIKDFVAQFDEFEAKLPDTVDRPGSQGIARSLPFANRILGLEPKKDFVTGKETSQTAPGLKIFGVSMVNPDFHKEIPSHALVLMRELTNDFKTEKDILPESQKKAQVKGDLNRAMREAGSDPEKQKMVTAAIKRAEDSGILGKGELEFIERKKGLSELGNLAKRAKREEIERVLKIATDSEKQVLQAILDKKEEKAEKTEEKDKLKTTINDTILEIQKLPKQDRGKVTEDKISELIKTKQISTKDGAKIRAAIVQDKTQLMLEMEEADGDKFVSLAEDGINSATDEKLRNRYLMQVRAKWGNATSVENKAKYKKLIDKYSVKQFVSNPQKTSSLLEDFGVKNSWENGSQIFDQMDKSRPRKLGQWRQSKNVIDLRNASVVDQRKLSETPLKNIFQDQKDYESSVRSLNNPEIDTQSVIEIIQNVPDGKLNEMLDSVKDKARTAKNEKQKKVFNDALAYFQ